MLNLEEIGLIKENDITTIANLNPVSELESESLSHAVRTIISSGHRRIPIISRNNDIVGIITYMDILDGLLRGLTKNTQIQVFMTREVVSSQIAESVGYVLQKLFVSKRGGLPITQKSKLVGLVSERDFIKGLSKHHFSIPVSEVMTPRPFYIPYNLSILNCMKAMVNTHYRRLPVVDGGEVVGIVTGLDVLKFINDVNYNQISLNENVEEIISTPTIHVSEQDDISDVVRRILNHDIGGVVVINEENSLRGIITERDIIELF